MKGREKRRGAPHAPGTPRPSPPFPPCTPFFWGGGGGGGREARRACTTHTHASPLLCSLDDKIKRLDAQLLVHRDAIRKARPGPAADAAKRRALAILKQKKLLEGQREQLYAQQFNMEQTAFALDSVKDTVQV